jgi:hypothetical protein
MAGPTRFHGRASLASPGEATHNFRVPMSSNGSGRRRGQQSRYLSGHVSALRRGTAQPTDAVQGAWTSEELLKMDARFVAAVEAARSHAGWSGAAQQARTGGRMPAIAIGCRRSDEIVRLHFAPFHLSSTCRSEACSASLTVTQRAHASGSISV